MKPTDLPLDQFLAHQAERMPRRTFVKFEGRKYTFHDMNALATVFAAYLLGRGMQAGDRIAILSCNCAEYIAAYFGIVRAGGVVLPVNNLLTHEEVGFMLQDAGVTTVFYDAECSGTVDRLKEKGGGSALDAELKGHDTRHRESYAAGYKAGREAGMREAGKEVEMYRWLRDWLVQNNLLIAMNCKPSAVAPNGDYWILRAPAVVCGDSCVGYGKDEDAAILSAIGGDK